jgi:predicted ATP-grasp superfamily ATP-dependent carboligase
MLAYEHIVAGGMPGEVPAALVEAGRAMWRVAVDDFAGAGCKVWTTFGEVQEFPRGGRTMVRVEPAGELLPLIRQLALKSDAAIIIAPESDGILESWLKEAATWKIPLLNCAPATVALCADKLELSRHLAKRGVPTVPTKGGELPVLLDSIAASLSATGGAYVIKPRDGAGCDRTYVCRSAEEAASLGGRLAEGSWIAQPYVDGLAASVSFIAHGQDLTPLLAGEQRIEGTHELHYAGGAMPLDPALSERASWIATQAVRTLTDLRGFIGVDVVLGKSSRDDVVIEINPRLTQSYCGLRALSKTNLAKAMIDEDEEIEWTGGRVTFDNAGKVTRE